VYALYVWHLKPLPGDEFCDILGLILELNLWAMNYTYTQALFDSHLFYFFLNSFCQFTTVVNLRPLIFGLTSYGWPHSIG
jgi:hypothetical protein